MNGSPNAMIAAARIWTKLVSPVGLSKGWAEFALKYPPPLLPSSLIASWLATSPPGTVGFAAGFPPTVVATSERSTGVMLCWPWKFWMTPWLRKKMASTKLSGNRIRVTARVMSTQKLPIVADRRRARPRIIATATASPTAADMKFWKTIPTVCVKMLTVDSGT